MRILMNLKAYEWWIVKTNGGECITVHWNNIRWQKLSAIILSEKKFKIVSIIASIVMNAHEKWAWKTQVICKQGNNVWPFPFKKFLFSFTPLVVKYNDNKNWKGKF